MRSAYLADPACLQKCAFRFDLKCVKGQSSGDCSTAFDCTDVDGDVLTHYDFLNRFLPTTARACCQSTVGEPFCTTYPTSSPLSCHSVGMLPLGGGPPSGSEAIACDHRGQCIPAAEALPGPVCTGNGVCLGTSLDEAECLAMDGVFEPLAYCNLDGSVTRPSAP